MKYQANPVIVDAFRIESVGPAEPTVTNPAAMGFIIGDGITGTAVLATAEMCARMTPVPGDYWVIQSDGYIYLNPKAVFERKYSPLGERKRPTIEELEKILASEGEKRIVVNPDGSITAL